MLSSQRPDPPTLVCGWPRSLPMQARDHLPSKESPTSGPLSCWRKPGLEAASQARHSATMRLPGRRTKPLVPSFARQSVDFNRKVIIYQGNFVCIFHILAVFSTETPEKDGSYSEICSTKRKVRVDSLQRALSLHLNYKSSFSNGNNHFSIGNQHLISQTTYNLDLTHKLLPQGIALRFALAIP